MSEPSRRDRAVEELSRALHWAARCVVVDPDDARAIVDLIIDAAVERVRGDIEDRLDVEAARAALDDAEVNGTVPWDEIKRDLGLQSDRTEA